MGNQCYERRRPDLFENREPGFQYFGWAFSLVFLTSCIVIGQYNFLLFHSLAEIAAVVVSCSIFVLAWNASLNMENSFFVFLGLSHLVIAIIQILHTLAYKGMGIFPGADANLPTQLWVGARYVEAFAILISPAFLTRRINPMVLVSGAVIVFTLVVGSIFTGVFPDCFVEGKGLTVFKRFSEYLICFVMTAALYLFWRSKSSFSPETFRYIAAYIVATIFAEIFFTFYINVYGISNFAGHVLKTAGVLFLFEATVASAIRQPFSVLYRKLSESLDSLSVERDSLQTALQEVKTLSGHLPICASCKKIRNDNGYWVQIESYISRHSDAKFSHGVCPDCATALYSQTIK